MKILGWLSRTWEGYISNKMAALCGAMARDPDFVPAWNYCAERETAVDAVLADQYAPPLPAWIPRQAVRMRLGGDMHRFTAAERDQTAAALAECDLVLSPYVFSRPQPNPYFWPPDEVRKKLVWLPHCVPDDPPPAAGVRNGSLLSGNTDPAVYPWRAWVKSLVLPGMDVLAHPGYSDPRAMTAARESYFATLSRYQAAFTCNSILDYTVAKYLEIPYSGCLLIAHWPNETDAGLLGLRHGDNCMFVRGEAQDMVASTLIAVRRGDLNHAIERGRQLVLSRHTARHRLAYLKRLVVWYAEHRRVPSDFDQQRLFLEES